METQTGDAGLTRRPTLASSLLLTRTGLGAQNFDWEELLAPPAPGFLRSQDLVSLKSSRSPQGGKPCFLYLTGDLKGEEEIDSVGLLSSARNMEVYVGEEYCGTSRGSSVCTILESSCCPVVKSSVFLSKVVAHGRPVPANSSPRSPALGSKIDLDEVQTVTGSVHQNYHWSSATDEYS
ncbi:ATPase PAAT-like [Erethizon dorsatum]